MNVDATVERTDTVEVLVNGEVVREADDYSAGTKEGLYCVREGDEVALRGSGGDGGERTYIPKGRQ